MPMPSMPCARLRREHSRTQEARPVLEELFAWMEEQSPGLPPSSPIAKAMGYMLKRKERMMHYLSDGRLLIDTNSTENLIRPVAVGRRNYLFAGSHCLSRTRSVREFSGIIYYSFT